MGRVLVVLLLLALLVGGVLWVYRDSVFRKQVSRRHIVLEQEIQRQARENYVLLEHTIGFLERLLEADSTFPLFSSARQREEAQALVTKFNQKQLDK